MPTTAHYSYLPTWAPTSTVVQPRAGGPSYVTAAPAAAVSAMPSSYMTPSYSSPAARTMKGVFTNMPSIITLDGARRRLADAWSDDSTPSSSSSSSSLGQATYSFISWGIAAFAVGTAAIRGYRAVTGFFGGGNVSGARRRRRR